MKANSIWPLAIIMTLGSSMPAWADQQSGGYYGPHMMWGGWYGMFFGPLMMLVFIAALIALVVVAIRWRGSSLGMGEQQSSNTTPLDILKERYARGEIDKDEFDERRRVLGE